MTTSIKSGPLMQFILFILLTWTSGLAYKSTSSLQHSVHHGWSNLSILSRTLQICTYIFWETVWCQCEWLTLTLKVAFVSLFKWLSILSRLTLMAVNSPSLSLITHRSPTHTPAYLDINYPDKTSNLCSDVSPALAVCLSLKSPPEIATAAHKQNQGF